MRARRAPILLYHRVGPRDGSYMDNYTVSPETFASQMHWLLMRKWRPVALREFVSHRLNACPTRAVAITFDDGFASNRDHAWPVLNELGIPAATFIVTGKMGLFNDWDLPQQARFRLLSAAELDSANSALMTFYPHSTTHPDLTFLMDDPERLSAEIRGSLETLPPPKGEAAVFAYPRGSWNWDLKLAVERAGYVAACTCMEGLNSAASDPFLLRRVKIEEDDVAWKLELKLRMGRDMLCWPPKRPPFIEVALARARRTGGRLAPLLMRRRDR